LAITGVHAWPRSDACHAVGVDLATAVTEYRAAQEALDAAKASVSASQARLRTARDELSAAVVAEATAGTRMRDLVAQTGLSREWIRTLLRKNGVMAD
jgi:hypothetical protein